MQNTPLPTSRSAAAALDRDDPLAPARAQFVLPDGLIYLDGNSLGLAPKAALAALDRAGAREWAHGLIRSWNDADWINLPMTTGARIARLVGAAPDEVVVCDSVSVNLFKLTMAMLGAVGNGVAVIVEEDEFPTDQYIAQKAAAIADVDFNRVGPGEGPQRVGDMGGVLVKSVVNYKTAAVADMAGAESEAARSGGGIVWDLSHATGVLAIDLRDVGATAATGCTYKFLNAGPGAPAFVYAANAIADRLKTPLPGWMGHAAPFEFSPDYAPKPGATRFAAGTPPILSLSALAGALDVFDGASIPELERKAALLGDICIARAAAMGLRTISPAIGVRRGGHVSLLHEEGYAVVQALAAEGVIGDFRTPNIMRFGFSPLFVRYQDIWDAMDKLEAVLSDKRWDRDEYKRRAQVT